LPLYRFLAIAVVLLAVKDIPQVGITSMRADQYEQRHARARWIALATTTRISHAHRKM
jgi:hypothetical protein